MQKRTSFSLGTDMKYVCCNKHNGLCFFMKRNMKGTSHPALWIMSVPTSVRPINLSSLLTPGLMESGNQHRNKQSSLKVSVEPSLRNVWLWSRRALEHQAGSEYPEERLSRLLHLTFESLTPKDFCKHA